MLRLLTLTFAPVLYALVVLTSACSGGDSSAPGEGSDLAPVPGNTTSTSSAPCQAGQTRTCKRTIGEFNGIVQCFSGVQVCGDHADWGPCEEKKH